MKLVDVNHNKVNFILFLQKGKVKAFEFSAVLHSNALRVSLGIWMGVEGFGERGVEEKKNPQGLNKFIVYKKLANFGFCSYKKITCFHPSKIFHNDFSL